ncbi:hypothetical protein HanIR_Chr03g0128851 [Helianthus annuus]|nr:hypothetical protein HanIR_Chr03g0128851 [Helianthus annuus]
MYQYRTVLSIFSTGTTTRHRVHPYWLWQYSTSLASIVQKYRKLPKSFGIEIENHKNNYRYHYQCCSINIDSILWYLYFVKNVCL